MPTPDVLIVGAGPTGLTLAAELLQHGTAPLVVEKSPVPSPHSRAIVVHARTLEVLEPHELSDALVAEGQVLRRIRMWGGDKVLVDVAFGGLPTRYPFLLALTQDRTEALLARRVAGLGGEIARGVALRSFDVREDHVRAELDDGRTLEVPWLVGCDGAHSPVRHGLGLAFEGQAYEQRLVLGDVRWDVDLPRDTLTTFLGEEFLACFPLADGRWRLIATRDAGDEAEEATLDALSALVAARTPFGGRLSEPRWLAHFRIHARQVAHYRRGRVLLAGDAAHVHSPAGGQGMNTGIQDAHNLGWKLALVHRGAPDALLDSYEAERHPVAAGVLRATGTATRIGTTKSKVVRALRDAIAPTPSQLSLVRDTAVRAVSELDIEYRTSPIVSDQAASAGRPAPGTFLPGRGGTKHTVLLHAGPDCGPHGQRRLRIVEALAARDPRLACARAEPMGMLADGVTVLRPDGYVGLRLGPADPERLLAWLDATLGIAP